MRTLINRYFKRTVKILSIDGGGIRGYIPALLLEELERRIENKGEKKPLGRLFDLLTGTSTGSIIALGLTAPQEETGGSGYSRQYAAYRAADIVEMYEENGLRIFPRRIFRQFQTMRHAFTEKYNDGQFHEVLGEAFGNRTVHDGLSYNLIPSYDIEKNEPVIMKKIPPRWGKKNPPNYYMSDAVRASSAAPTYFEPIRVSSIDGARQHTLIDGGVYANNPAMCGYVEAQRIYPKAHKYIILSLGTGSISRNWNYEQVKNWGVLDWIQPSKGVPIAYIMNRGQAGCVDYQLNHLSNVEYYRLDVPLSGCSPTMDDAASENMSCLRRKAEEEIDRYTKTLDYLADILT